MTPTDRIERAISEQKAGDAVAAQTHALIAIAELLQAAVVIWLNPEPEVAEAPHSIVAWPEKRL
jgi:hypothetical protein